MSKEAKRYSCGNGDGMIEDKNGFYVKYSQPTLFKVATEDSCVVLEKPSTPEEPYLSDTDCDVHTQWKIYLGRYNKAPSISEDRLELNKLRVENEKLTKEKDLYFNKAVEYQTNNDLQAEALIEYEEVLKEFANLETGNISALKSTPKQRLEKAIELLSKLNKD